jgi:hypothetical protein
MSCHGLCAAKLTVNWVLSPLNHCRSAGFNRTPPQELNFNSTRDHMSEPTDKAFQQAFWSQFQLSRAGLRPL